MSGIVHTIIDARIIIQNWIENRMKSGKKIAVGTLLEGQFIYPWAEEQSISSRFEPAFHYTGMIRDDASDEEAEELLNDLATELAKKLNQQRVHVEFCSTYFILENDN